MGNLSDTYSLKKDEGNKPDSNCIDGCIYTRLDAPGDEYCFKNGLTDGDATCEVSLWHKAQFVVYGKLLEVVLR